MDIEQLTKAQTVLLTLLVSFVTSIATGIVTVTLLDQAPPAITQTINRVVERTVERVVPDDSQNNAAAAVVTTEKTVVVKEEDLITDSIQKNTRHLVRVYQASASEGEKGAFLGLGVIVTRDGIVAVDTANVAEGGTYRVEVSSGSIYTAAVVQKKAESDIALLALKLTEEEAGATFLPVAFASQGSLKLGQTVLSLGGESRTNVATGIISGFTKTDPVPAEVGADGKEETEAVPAKIVFVETTITDRRILSGSPVITVFGEVIGLSTAGSRTRGGAGAYTPIEDIRGELSTLLESSKTAEKSQGDAKATR